RAMRQASHPVPAARASADPATFRPMAQSPHPSADDRAAMRIDASPSDIYALITDVAGMGRFSPECTGGTWLDGATGPEVGARFKGTNRPGVARWSTTSTVVEAAPGRACASGTKQSGTRWRYELEPAEEGGTLLIESRESWRSRPLVARVFTAL